MHLMVVVVVVVMMTMTMMTAAPILFITPCISLANAINEFDGGCVLVSHDFRLIQQVSTRARALLLVFAMILVPLCCQRSRT